MIEFAKALKHKPPFYEPTDRPESLVSLSYCLECCTVAALNDISPANPCPSCGGQVTGNKLYGQWERRSGGWFRAKVGEWIFTVRTRNFLADLYNHLHNPKLVRAHLAGKTNSDCGSDLDFTK